MGKNWISDPNNFNDPFELSLPSDVEFCSKTNKLLYITGEEKKNKDIIKSCNENIGIICYSKTPDNVLLWSHYGDNHSGICLSFEPDVSYNYDNIDFEFDKLNFVKYSQTIPKPNLKNLDMNDIKDIFCTKSKVWEYEEEIRQVFNKKSQYVDYPGELKEVYFGCNTPDRDIELIISLLKDRGIKFWFCERQEGQFSLITSSGQYHMKKYNLG